MPVCGRNGNTYPSACVARCTGILDADIEFGPCSAKSPCDNVNCPGNGVCVEKRQVCLSVMHRPCQQYECGKIQIDRKKNSKNNGIILTVNVTTSCPIPFAEEACSTDGRTFPSFCNLVKSKSRLAYKGPCLKYCNYHTKEKVCGINGVTYKSECDAWSGMSSLTFSFHI